MAATKRAVTVVHEPLQRTLLGNRVREGPLPPDWLVKDWLYRGRHHTMYGQPESGKTWLVVYCCARIVKAGGRVVYLDEENGENRMAERLAAFDVSEEEADERFFYYWEPRLTSKQRERLLVTLAEVEPDLVVFDSAAHFYNWADLNEYNNQDAVRWYMHYVFDPCATVGAASTVIDHEAKRSTVDGSRGAGAKQQVTEVSYKVGRRGRFNRKVVGKVEVELTKDRDGHLPLGRVVTLGGAPFQFEVEASGVTITRVKGNAKKGITNEVLILAWVRERGDHGATAAEAVDHFDGVIGKSTVNSHLKRLSAVSDAEVGLRRVPLNGAQTYYYKGIEASES